MRNLENNRFCPAYEKNIDAVCCYDSAMVFLKFINTDTIKETAEIKDFEKAYEKCINCPYSDNTEG